jgi:hypothetical protein
MDGAPRHTAVGRLQDVDMHVTPVVLAVGGRGEVHVAMGSNSSTGVEPVSSVAIGLDCCREALARVMRRHDIAVAGVEGNIHILAAPRMCQERLV